MGEKFRICIVLIVKVRFKAHLQWIVDMGEYSILLFHEGNKTSLISFSYDRDNAF